MNELKNHHKNKFVELIPDNDLKTRVIYHHIKNEDKEGLYNYLLNLSEKDYIDFLQYEILLTMLDSFD
jgi:hypothetical protein